MKTVSVIIPTYKRSKYIARTIESVLSQTYNNIEIIVVDDNNGEDEYRAKTRATIKKYIESGKIKYICHDRNMGGCAARNTGLKESSGDYVCYLDDDDFLYKEKIKEQVNFLEKHKEIDIVYCFRKIGNLIHAPNITGDISYCLLSGDSIIITIMLMIRKKNADKVKWNLNLKRNQEAGYLLDLINKANCRVGRIDKVLCESDTSDRSNALNPKKNEKEMLNYLKQYEYVIERLAQKDKRVKKKIYSHRYYGIFLQYIKTKHFKDAIRILIKAEINCFSEFNKHILRYTIKKITKNTDFKKANIHEI